MPPLAPPTIATTRRSFPAFAQEEGDDEDVEEEELMMIGFGGGAEDGE